MEEPLAAHVFQLAGIASHAPSVLTDMLLINSLAFGPSHETGHTPVPVTSDSILLSLDTWGELCAGLQRALPPLGSDPSSSPFGHAILQGGPNTQALNTLTSTLRYETKT